MGVSSQTTTPWGDEDGAGCRYGTPSYTLDSGFCSNPFDMLVVAVGSEDMSQQQCLAGEQKDKPERNYRDPNASQLWRTAYGGLATRSAFAVLCPWVDSHPVSGNVLVELVPAESSVVSGRLVVVIG